MLKSGSTVGILGGGQLGRMLSQAAAKLGLRAHVFSSEADACARQVVEHFTHADFTDTKALKAFARKCDVVTYEFENVPAKTTEFLVRHTRVRPGPEVLHITQDRLIEKNFIRKLGIPSAPYLPVSSAADLITAVKILGLPAVLKTRRFGYDGKGQVKLHALSDVLKAWRAMRGAPCIVERWIGFQCEVSVVAARSRQGAWACFDVTENKHRDHILRESLAPARISGSLATQAQALARSIANAFDYVGVLAVEMFVVRRGRNSALLVNEIAPRVHNSGHWTLDGASVSQFEQHIRAVADWPLATPQRLQRVKMVNLIGSEVVGVPRWLEKRGASVHLYGKKTIRAGRKMGHVTMLLP